MITKYISSKYVLPVHISHFFHVVSALQLCLYVCMYVSFFGLSMVLSMRSYV